MKTPFWWKDLNIISLLLLPIALIYNWCYKIRCFINKNPYRSKIPVICVGNLVVGGSGKTPIAISISKILRRKKQNFCFLSKGYKGHFSGVVKVDPMIHTAKDVGDEPLMLTNYGDVFVSKNRVEGLKYINALTDVKYDFIIMDDGLQNPTFYKDIPLLIINGRYGLGNGLLFPAGPLRETFNQAKEKTKRVVIVDKDKHGIKDLCHSTNKKYLFGENRINLIEDFYKYKFVAFAGLGLPQKFFDTLEECNILVVKKIPFEDHHLYTENDIVHLRQLTDGGKYKLITTQKDWIRLADEDKKDIYYLDLYVNLFITEKNNFFRKN